MAINSLDSAAVFKQRALQIGLKEDAIEALQAKGWATFASLALSSAHIPGQSSDDVFVEKVIVPILGNPSHVDAAKLRRLHFEAYTATANEMRHKLDHASDDVPKKLPQAERSVRIRRLASRLPGLRLDGNMEPSHHLIDAVATMVDENSLKYISWAECLSRDDEAVGIKRSREWKADASGTLKEILKPLKEEHRADTSTDLRILQALHRRGAACDVGGLMTYAQHDCLVQDLLRELQRQPPAGFLAVTHEQLQRADREVWRMAAETTAHSGIAMTASGTYPVAEAFKTALSDARVRALLIPMAAPASSTSTKRTADQLDKANPSSKKPRVAPKRGNGTMKLPDALQGTPTTIDGSRICYAFNLKKCSSAKGCVRGKHVCTLCYGSHAYLDCPKAGSKH